MAYEGLENNKNAVSNLQPLKASENMSKGNRYYG